MTPLQGTEIEPTEMKPPQEIFIQWHGDSEPSEAPVFEPEVTWSRDRVFEHDVRYVLSDDRSGYILAMRLLQSNLNLDDDVRAAISSFTKQ